MSEKSLPFSFRRIVRQATGLQQKTKTVYVKYLNEVCSELYGKADYDQILKTKCVDTELYIQLSEAEA